MKNNTTENQHSIVSSDQWLAARRELLRQEKEFDRQRDALAARRRELPWEKVEKPYVFEGPRGPVTLADLFAGRSQLIVYHFMLAPGWEEGCRGCSFVSDHIDGAIPHLQAKDVSFAVVSRAPLAEIQAFKARMGWKFEWVSSHRNDFNRDYRVSFTEAEMATGKVNYNYTLEEVPMEEMPGLSVFARDAVGNVYHTYSTYSRGLDRLINTYNFLDLAPKGRNENPEHPMDWVRHHDRYELALTAS
jgi:predicted dithiol-disulfide oxidoreductase (DUF899 family)